MVTVEELKAAMEERNDALKKELRENRRVIANAEQWRKEIDVHVEAARDCFGIASETEEVIEWDPETGAPYVCIKVDVRDRGATKAYHRYVRRLMAVKYMHLILLDARPVDADSPVAIVDAGQADEWQ